MEEDAIRLVPLNPELFDLYIETGTKSYRQHYLHLWQKRDPDFYIKNAFRHNVVKQEWENPGVRLFMIYLDTTPAGILKIALQKKMGKEAEMDCLFLERIYLLTEFTGKGIGTAVLDFSSSMARELGRAYLCLETMQKGPALKFYLQNHFTIIGTKLLEYPGLVEEERPMFIMGKKLK